MSYSYPIPILSLSFYTIPISVTLSLYSFIQRLFSFSSSKWQTSSHWLNNSLTPHTRHAMYTHAKSTAWVVVLHTYWYINNFNLHKKTVSATIGGLGKLDDVLPTTDMVYISALVSPVRVWLLVLPSSISTLPLLPPPR